MIQFLKNELDGFNDCDSLDCKFWTQKFVLQSACLKSLWAKTGILVIIPAQLRQIYSDLPNIYWHALRPTVLDLFGVPLTTGFGSAFSIYFSAPLCAVVIGNSESFGPENVSTLLHKDSNFAWRLDESDGT